MKMQQQLMSKQLQLQQQQQQRKEKKKKVEGADEYFETTQTLIVKSNTKTIKAQQHNRKQLSSFILFLSIVIFVNLCPFHPELELTFNKSSSIDNDLNNIQRTTKTFNSNQNTADYLKDCYRFITFIFTNPSDFNRRNGPRRGSIQAEARVIGKMAKMWYIKKKIKKLSKKLKKHTIAVPVFTAIPIYEHSYYPQPHVTHVSHGGLHHAAASSYSPALAQVATTTSGQTVVGSVPATTSQGQQLAASASTNHQQLAHPYRPMAGGAHHHHHHSVYHPMQAASGHQIINSYAPSPPLYVDEAGGFYGTYNNAYSNIPYNGGYHLW